MTGSREAKFNVPTSGFGFNSSFERVLAYKQTDLHRPKLLNAALDYSTRRGVLNCKNDLRVKPLRSAPEKQTMKPPKMGGGGLFASNLSSKRLVPAASMDGAAVSNFKKK